MPEPKDRRRARWERRIAPLLAEADACDGPCRAACRLWARFVRTSGPERLALAPGGHSR